MISMVFWTADRKWSFQRVDKDYLLYNQDGDYERAFKSFWKMCEYIKLASDDSTVYTYHRG